MGMLRREPLPAQRTAPRNGGPAAGGPGGPPPRPPRPPPPAAAPPRRARPPPPPPSPPTTRPPPRCRQRASHGAGWACLDASSAGTGAPGPAGLRPATNLRRAPLRLDSVPDPQYLRLTWTDPVTGRQGFLVVDRLVGGRAGGGTRMRAGCTLEEGSRLGAARSLKNGALAIPPGAAQCAVDSDPPDPARMP